MARHLLLALLGLLLLLLAGPRVVSNYYLAVGDSAYELISLGAPMARQSLERARRSREAALTVLETGEAAKELGHILLRDALERPLRDPERIALLETAVERLRQGLARDPADLFAWYHLALAEWWLGRLRDAARALAMSYRAGPHHPPIAVDRGMLALALWPHLAAPARARAAREICLVLRRSGEALRRFAESSARAEILDEIANSATCRSPATTEAVTSPPRVPP